MNAMLKIADSIIGLKVIKLLLTRDIINMSKIINMLLYYHIDHEKESCEFIVKFISALELEYFVHP